MKLITFSTDRKRAQVGIVRGEKVYDIGWTDPMHEVIRRRITPTMTSEHYPLDKVQIQAPLRPGKIIAIGRNYGAHAAELGNEPPTKPLIFAKYPSSIIGPGEVISWRGAMTQEVDWEGELAVIIGRTTRNATIKDAHKSIFGYTIANDVTARDLQSSESQWVRAKSLDTFCPLGPVIITRDEITDPHDLTIQTRLNGDVVQDSNTGHMIYKIPFLIAYCSEAFTLEPGDIILTGTPEGVGKGMKPPRFLTTGDEISVTISGIGTLTNTCKRID